MKISLFVPNLSSGEKKAVKFLNKVTLDHGDLIKNKREAIKAVTFLMSEWKISLQDFVNEYNKKKGSK